MTLVAWVAVAAIGAPAGPPDAPPARREVVADSRQMLAIASRALAAGQTMLARKVLTALLADPAMPVRNEARFRLAMMAASERRWSAAGVLLRAILDEEPTAPRARLELARVEAEAGDIAASQRTLRAARAGTLPPDVARVVDRFASALRERRSHGASFKIALAPDSNVNRATRSQTVGTVIGDFTLDPEARRSSGVGLAIEGEGFIRRPLSGALTLLATAGISGDLYRERRFNDVLATGAVGPEFALSGGRSRVLFGGQRRWRGGRRYADAITATFDWSRAAGRRAQARGEAVLGRTSVAGASLQNATSLAASVSIERALGTRAGAGAVVGGNRQRARDPAYSLAGGQISLFGWCETRPATLTLVAAYQHLEADRRLDLFPRRRVEDFTRVSLAAAFRHIAVRGWAPEVRLIWERNASSVEVYAYRRVRADIGVVRAF